MLVLSRKKNQIVDIPGIGSLMIVEIRGDKVRLGFDFEPGTRIYRREVWLEIQKQNAAAAEGAADEEAAEVSH